ncbi:hypothetical protein GCM10018953_35440 [Streptosporangium nondiastaticum]
MVRSGADCGVAGSGWAAGVGTGGPGSGDGVGGRFGDRFGVGGVPVVAGAGVSWCFVGFGARVLFGFEGVRGSFAYLE